MEDNPQWFFILDVRQEEDKWNDKTNPHNRGLDGLSNWAYFFDDIKYLWLFNDRYIRYHRLVSKAFRDYFSHSIGYLLYEGYYASGLLCHFGCQSRGRPEEHPKSLLNDCQEVSPWRNRHSGEFWKILRIKRGLRNPCWWREAKRVRQRIEKTRIEAEHKSVMGRRYDRQWRT